MKILNALQEKIEPEREDLYCLFVKSSRPGFSPHGVVLQGCNTRIPWTKRFWFQSASLQPNIRSWNPRYAFTHSQTI